MNQLPKYKLFVKAENKIYNNISYLGLDYTRNEIEAKIRIFSYNDSDNILLPYWRTIPTSQGDIELYQGDVFQLGAFYDGRRIVRYNEKEACFKIARVNELKDEDMTDIWQQPIPSWWVGVRGRITYLGNEHINPELLEEK